MECYMTDSLTSEVQRPRVLLVEDEASIRRLLYTLLERAGYEVLSAATGGDGLKVFRQSSRPIELLVTDYEMPGMTGLELAVQCCSLNRTLGVLYVSGSEPDVQLQLDLRAQKRAFLGKPFHASELLKKAHSLLTECYTPLATSA
jgi:CheY-like chemotaxis protein